MSKWISQIKESEVDAQFSSYEKKRVELTPEEIEAIMPKVVEFYNLKPQERPQPIFTHKGGVFAIVKTPDATYDDNKVLKQKFDKSKYPDYDTKEDTYSLNGVKILYNGQSEFLTIYATIGQWKQICKVKDTREIPRVKFMGKKAIIFGDLSVKYQSQIEVEDPKTKVMKKPQSKPLASFLKMLGVHSLDDVDPSEYRIFYQLKIWQIVE